MSTIVRNGKTYNNADIDIAMFGSMDYEITSITYEVIQTHTANYSLGSDKPTSYSMGKKTYTCTLGVRMGSISQLEKVAGGDLLNIKPFDIVVNFVNDDNEQIQDRIKVKFASQKHASPTSADDITVTFSLFCLDIQFNVK